MSKVPKNIQKTLLVNNRQPHSTPKTTPKKKSTRKHLPSMSDATLRQILNYDPNSGDFTWLINISKQRQRGDIAFRFAPTLGRVQIEYNKKQYSATDLAYRYMIGGKPKGVVRHLDGDVKNLNWWNLEWTTRAKSNGKIVAKLPKSSKSNTTYKGITLNPETDMFDVDVLTPKTSKPTVWSYKTLDTAKKAKLKNMIHHGQITPTVTRTVVHSNKRLDVWMPDNTSTKSQSKKPSTPRRVTSKKPSSKKRMK